MKHYWNDSSSILNDAHVTILPLISLSDAVPVRNAGFGEGNGSILLDNLRCSGDEESLLDCLADDDVIGSHDCNHDEDAGVRCGGMYVRCIPSLPTVSPPPAPFFLFLLPSHFFSLLFPLLACVLLLNISSFSLFNIIF